MSHDVSAVRPRPPFRRVLDRLVSALVRAGVPMPVALLEVPGRRTGQVRSTPVSPVEVEGALYLVAPSGQTHWARNLRAAGRCALRHGHRREQFRAVELGPEHRGPVIAAYVARQPGFVRREFGVYRGATAEQFRAIAHRHPVFRLEPVARDAA